MAQAGYSVPIQIFRIALVLRRWIVEARFLANSSNSINIPEVGCVVGVGALSCVLAWLPDYSR